ncbi:UTP--glucose-1-phosphate uridylyltransferase [Jeotgalibaca sp. PTS2502]|uniref:UTP--glucose-1-phosphate uridylyltransferase GalU n=1 Tax=Jeotgalibaca sp. PTS2502 TaxID=1903686 RepID=UPI000973588F|nr:UTP--glucose-1-phosphate uridylyltransferase GalU [Jeotgalibaca sp. PTS2502]APZ49230.1 UTP--glucose-1-phosphate uridylyltransferase [Jeotgalibaca sp. PTS2502]
MQKIRKAVIPAAGLGTRFLPATKAMAKEMMPVVDTPSIQFVVEEALKSGIEEILIITGKGKNAIEDHFDANISLENNLIEKGKDDLLKKVQSTTIPSIHYVRQAYPKGLGDAILQARPFVGDEPFVVLLGDDIMPNDQPLTKTLMDLSEQYAKGIVATIQIPKEKSDRFGIIDIKDEIEPHLFSTNHLVEKPLPEQAPSTLGIVGRYVLPAEIFTILENQEPDQGGEIQLTDALETLNKQNALLAYKYMGTRYDVGDKYGMLVANIEIGLNHAETSDKMKEHIIELAKTLKK